MDINTKEFGTFIDNLIEQRARAIVQEQMKKYGNLRAWDGIVSEINGNLVSVKLIGDDIPITGLKNKSGQTLIVGDEVYLHSISSLNNAYVAIAKNKP